MILPTACNPPIILFASLTLLLSLASSLPELSLSASEGSKSEGVIVEVARDLYVLAAGFWYIIDFVVQVDIFSFELAYVVQKTY